MQELERGNPFIFILLQNSLPAFGNLVCVSVSELITLKHFERAAKAALAVAREAAAAEA